MVKGKIGDMFGGMAWKKLKLGEDPKIFVSTLSRKRVVGKVKRKGDPGPNESL